MFLTFYKCFYRCHNYLNKVFARWIHWLLAKGCHHREYSYKKNPLSSSMLICCSYANIAQTLMLIYSKQQIFQLCSMSQHQTHAISLLLEVEPPNFQPMFLSICGMRICKNLIFKNCELCLKRCCAYTYSVDNIFWCNLLMS